MKVIIAGSRNLELGVFSMRDIVNASGFDITEVVSGTARGVDSSGEHWAEYHDIPVKRFPADWKRFGKSAGAIRNAQMAHYADALIAIWDGESRGTKNMIDIANKKRLKVYVQTIV